MKSTNLMTYKSLLSKPESSSGKTLNELNLMDAYLFETVTNNPVFAEKMAKMNADRHVLILFDSPFY